MHDDARNREAALFNRDQRNGRLLPEEGDAVGVSVAVETACVGRIVRPLVAFRRTAVNDRTSQDAGQKAGELIVSGLK